MKSLRIFTAILLCSFGVFAQSVALVSGKGAPGVLEIGMRCSEVLEPDSCIPGVWLHDSISGLEFRISEERRAINTIRCSRKECSAELNVRVGVTEQALLKRYGNPVAKKPILLYNGIAFAVSGGLIEAIYIFPPGQ
jgi:hypothetical protein